MTHQNLLSQPILWVLVWATFEALAMFALLRWALTRPVKIFYSIFAGGTLLRLASLLAVALLLNSLHIAPAAPLLALVFTYFVYSLIQIPFLGKT